ncbi:MAG: J domain-containing protein [Acidimicrobiales bacterium]
MAGVEPDHARAAELAERFRSRAARDEAQRELVRLRLRHWSGDRVIEEASAEAEWWEHAEADPFAVLGLLPGAAIDEAAHARRRIAQRCHPDRIQPDDERSEIALRRMVAANAAYDRLRRALHPV